MKEIDLIEKFIIFMIVAASFLFCFWQEFDEKKKACYRLTSKK